MPIPKRWILWYVPEGVSPGYFWPSTTGPLAIDLDAGITGGRSATWSLQPLARWQGRITLVDGLHNDVNSGDTHSLTMEGLLTGQRTTNDRGPTAASIDQLAADALGTRAARLGVMGFVQGNPRHRTLSFGGGGTRLTSSWNPAADYDSLFPGGIATEADGDDAQRRRRVASRLAMLGAVRSEIARARCVSGARGAERMEQYLASIERVESGLRAVGPPPVMVDVDPRVRPEHRDASFWNDRAAGTGTYEQLGTLMTDIAVAAAALRVANVVTLQWAASGNEGDRKYDSIVGLESPGRGDHGLSHPESGSMLDPASADRDRARVYRWYAERLGYLLDRLERIPEGDGTLLDHTVITWVSDMGNREHSTRRVPFACAGDTSVLRGGTYVDAAAAGPRPVAQALLAVARRVGADVPRLGDHASEYADMLV